MTVHPFTPLMLGYAPHWQNVVHLRFPDIKRFTYCMHLSIGCLAVFSLTSSHKYRLQVFNRAGRVVAETDFLSRVVGEAAPILAFWASNTVVAVCTADFVVVEYVFCLATGTLHLHCLSQLPGSAEYSSVIKRTDVFIAHCLSNVRNPADFAVSRPSADAGTASAASAPQARRHHVGVVDHEPGTVAYLCESVDGNDVSLCVQRKASADKLTAVLPPFLLACDLKEDCTFHFYLNSCDELLCLSDAFTNSEGVLCMFSAHPRTVRALWLLLVLRPQC